MKAFKDIVHTSKNELLDQWSVAKKELDKAKELELSLREAIVAQLPSIPEGTSKQKCGTELITVVGRVNRRITGDIPKSLCKYVEYKPALVMSKYRTCTEIEKKRFEQCLTVSEGTPSIKL